MADYDYAIYDVFTDKALRGNPLAVVFEADDLSDDQMQAIAAEFNLSETAFVRMASDKNHTAALRIFMPLGELPFAGHPTVGSAVAICERDDAKVSRILMLEEKVGPVRCAFDTGEIGYAEFDLPVLSKREIPMLEKDKVALALGLTEDDIGFENHVLSRWNAGVPYLCVPVRDLEAAGRVRFDQALWLSYFPDLDPLNVHCPYVYCRETVHQDASIHARMFAPHHGIVEDPATGSAAAALSGALNLFDGLLDGSAEYVIEQGMEMGRASKIRIEMEVTDSEISAARIGGSAVCVAKGTLFV